MTEAAAANSGGGDPGAAAAAASAAASGAAAAGSGAAAPWYPDTAKALVEGKGWKSPADAITSYTALETLMGADKAGRTVVMPKDATDVEGTKLFRARLGVPESADKYELPAPSGQGGAEMIKEASGWFHEAGIPKSAAQAITAKWNSHIEGLIKAGQDKAQGESAAQLDKLKGEWGQEFDKNAEYARRFLKAAGWDDAKMAQYEATFGTATMLKDFHQWGTKIGEHGFVAGEGKGGFTPARQAIQQKIDDLRTRRIAGGVSDKDFNAQMSVLGPQLEAA